MSKLDIEKIKLIVKNLAQKYHLSLVVLFGSQVSGKTHAKSDTDIAYMSETQMKPYDVAKMQLELIQYLKIRNIELIDLHNAPPLLLREIARQSIALYEKDQSRFARLKIYAIKRYMEAKPLLDLRTKSREDFVKNYVR